MSAVDSSLIVPGHGTFFFGEEGSTLPTDPLTAFALDATAPSGWIDIGHTSTENTIAFSKDGGDTTQLNTWYRDAVRVVYGALTWGATIGALQVTGDTLDLAFGGQLDEVGGRYIVPATPQPKSGQGVILFQDSTDSMLFYMPKIQVTIGDAPSVSTEQFFEIQLALSILASATLTANGKSGLMAIYKASFLAAGN